jgi:hypothetical protein
VFLRTETGSAAVLLGTLAVTGPRFPDRVRAFLLSVAVGDDLVSLVVIGAAYSKAVALAPLGIAAGIFAVTLVLRHAGIRYGIIYAVAGIAAWVAVLKPGVDPVVVGLVMGLLTFAYPATRTDLERASDLFRSFREQPTPEFAQSARAGAARIAEDVDTADLSGVSGTPTFFINGRGHYGSYDITAGEPASRCHQQAGRHNSRRRTATSHPPSDDLRPITQHAVRKRREITSTFRTMRTRERAAPFPSLAARPPCTRLVKPQVRLSNVQPGDRAADEHPLDF